MATVLAITNQKGGVGKTTTCVNLAASLCQEKKSILLIDMDPQGNATMGCGVNKHTAEHILTNVILDNIALDSVIEQCPHKFSVLPANDNLTKLEVKLLELPNREKKLFFLLEEIQDQYDFILIDCPPSLNMLTVNALVAADGVLIPMQCEYYALEGLSALVKTINTLRRSVNPRLKIEGIVRTMYDNRNRLAQDVTNELTEHFGQKVFKTVIPRNVRLAEAPSHGVPILFYDKRSRGAVAYQELAKELLIRFKNTNRAFSVA